MKTALALTLALLPLLAAAQQQTTIWRCGADGRSYSATPCAEGRMLEAVASRPEADLQAAHEIAAREQRLADRLRSERLQQERLAAATGPAGFRTSAAVKPSATASARDKRPRPPAAAGTSRAIARASRPARG